MVDKRQVLCVVLGITAAVIGFFVDNPPGRGRDQMCLERFSYGGGDRWETVRVQGLLDEEIRLEISVGERQYGGREAKVAIDEAIRELEKIVPGENPSLSEVRTPLVLPLYLEKWGISVRWEPEDEWIRGDGTLEQETCPPEGVKTALRAVLQAGAYSEEHTFPVTVFPVSRTPREEKTEGFLQMLRQLDESQSTGESLILPDEYEGKTLCYRTDSTRTYLLLPFLGVAAAALIPLLECQKAQERKKARERQLMEDYPEIVSKLAVFSGAGLPVRKAWERIVLDYEEGCRGGKRPRAAYQEMAASYHRMQRGVPELHAYAEFGNNCHFRLYRRLSGLLEQNIRNGSAGLREALEAEMEAAFEQQKALARRKGEEASTRLLLPLFLMLMIVVIMVSVPAFLAFGL